MHLHLLPHPDTPDAVLASLEVHIERRGAELELRYLARGAIQQLSIPPQASAERADELWQHTCFEAFLRTSAGRVYAEFNFAPSRRWAAYSFTSYRTGMAPLALDSPPQITFDATSHALSLTATVQLPAPFTDALELAVSAVIEARAGSKSYWALQHAPGKPDFHHQAGFIARL
jgi:hypothetical protein